MAIEHITRLSCDAPDCTETIEASTRITMASVNAFSLWEEAPDFDYDVPPGWVITAHGYAAHCPKCAPRDE
jgi:hypothetical protein